jgi:hypothetical protein
VASHPLYDEGKAKVPWDKGEERFGGGGGLGNNRKLCGFGFCSFGELGEKGVLFSLEKKKEP